MLLLSELKKYGFVRRLTNLSQMRLDYIQDVVLSLIFQEHPCFVFKGGTSLWKLFKLPRFSEDLDISTGRKTNPTEDVVKKLRLLGFEAETVKNKTTGNTVFSRVRAGSKNFGWTEVSLQFSFHKEPGIPVNFHSPYPDIGDFELTVSDLNKVASDKVNAIISRQKPRDLFDLYFLTTRHQVRFKVDDFELFKNAVELKRKSWKSLGPLVVGKLPDFEEVKKVVLRKAVVKRSEELQAKEPNSCAVKK